ncbi:uncharacterized protein N7498_011013 [Penicillium cinerascens]|uniref:Alpha-1,6-mannosyltransferase Och1 n=1 Tax=Penicillium cinerascens TaxID=70096 RepID=A0A9W9J7K9_9EURO|nr:uncharacterized protein N7498_011013 [Penicillium cinerascens]KAJ5192028.1 hypothetical protein N7498_011013 [Penicillium cinerascens]
MFKDRLERFFVLSMSFVPFFKNSWRLPNFKSRMLKTGFITVVWLLLVVAFLDYSFNGHIGRSIEPSAEEKEIQPDQDWHSLLPQKMWQIYLAPPTANKTSFQIDPQNLVDTGSWLAHNPEYEYVLVGDKGAESLVRQHFMGNPTLLRIFRELQNTGMKSDLLRYLILSKQGGVYSDIDTVNLKPIDQWVPEGYQKNVRVVIGVEFDRLDGGNWGEVHPDLQFCQWTIAATPGHPLFSYMIDWVISALEIFMEGRQTTFSELKVKSAEVMKMTGPAAWTDAVFRQLQQYEPDLTSLRNLSGLVQPRLIGDILIFPIDGFGMGQPHSNSTRDGSIPEEALVQHKFRGSWRHNDMS